LRPHTFINSYKNRKQSKTSKPEGFR